MCPSSGVSHLGICSSVPYPGLVLFMGSRFRVWCVQRGFFCRCFASYSTTNDTEEVFDSCSPGRLANLRVVQSFDTVDRGTLDCAEGRLGLPADHGWRYLPKMASQYGVHTLRSLVLARCKSQIHYSSALCRYPEVQFFRHGCSSFCCTIHDLIYLLST